MIKYETNGTTNNVCYMSFNEYKNKIIRNIENVFILREWNIKLL